MAPKKMMEPLFQITSLTHLMVNSAKSEYKKKHIQDQKKREEKNHRKVFLQNAFSLQCQRQNSFIASLKTKTNI